MTDANTAARKPSRWDRPPEPHDWRWVVGHIGRALIALGLLMFAFVGYQLWGTGIQEARSQDKLGQDFATAIHDAGLDTTTTVATVDPGVTPTTIVQTTPEPQDQVFPQPIVAGEVVASIKIPRINVNKYVVAGVGVQDLRKGVGHFPNTPFPGQLGNAAIAGHRTTYGQPFYSLDKLQTGDEIDVSTILGGNYVYVVTTSEEVGKNDYHVITDSDPTRATLTLITCTPIGTSSRRLVVHADLVVAQSSPVGKAALYYGQTPSGTTAAGTAAPSLPDDVAETSTTSAVVTSVVSVTHASSPTDDTATPTATTATEQPGGFATPDDAFNQGWFADGGAWPHVLGWGAVLLGIWLGCYHLAKRHRRLWLGFLVGFVPFVVVLYFFFENVNRLLPAAI